MRKSTANGTWECCEPPVRASSAGMPGGEMGELLRLLGVEHDFLVIHVVGLDYLAVQPPMLVENHIDLPA